MTLPVVHIVVGTRPEAVKMAPLAAALRASGAVRPGASWPPASTPPWSTQALAAFGQRPDVALELDRRTGEQVELVAELAPRARRILARDGSAAVVVQGDTTSVLVGGLVAFWRRIPLVHLEAGLRSGDLTSPFPEEANRRLIGVVADLHLAPTRRAADALLREHVDPDRVLLVGNTVVDAVLAVAAQRRAARATRGWPDRAALDAGERAADAGDRAPARVLGRAAATGCWTRSSRSSTSTPTCSCVLPAHANPAVRAQVDRALAGHPRVVVTGPLPYAALCRLLSALVRSCSATPAASRRRRPSFRRAGAGAARGDRADGGGRGGLGAARRHRPGRIVAAAKGVLDGIAPLPATGNPFGDGHSARRGAEAIGWLLGHGSKPEEFASR